MNLDLWLLFVAVWGLIVVDNLIKKVMCLSIVESMLILEFLKIGFVASGAAPILNVSQRVVVDPVPQALMLTAIVIGMCFNALACAVIVRLYRQTGTVLVSELGNV